ncbi:hypothetical protein EBS80_01135 [bacterium]|nr:hypothetical protein [bacterium]
MNLHERLSALLSEDAERIDPSDTLAATLRLRAERRHAARRTAWRVSTVFAAAGVAAIALVMVASSAKPGQRSVIASAQAAYENLHEKWAEPGAIRHIVTAFSFGGTMTTMETWSTADGSRLLSGSVDMPNFLQTDGFGYLEPSDVATSSDSFVVSAGGTLRVQTGGVFAVTTEGSTITMTDDEDGIGGGTELYAAAPSEDTAPNYVVTQPPNTASVDEYPDPNDPSVLCVDVTPLTETQRTARDLMERINEASESVNTGKSGPERLLTLLTDTPSAEDRGTQSDAIVGTVRVYRISYGSFGRGTEGRTGFQEFGISEETSALRLTRSGSVDADGTEHVESVNRILTDEILSADQVPTDLFSAERLGFERMPPPDEDNPDSWPTFELRNGCFREGPTEPEWLLPSEEAAARARIKALGPDAPSMGGGGF